MEPYETQMYCVNAPLMYIRRCVMVSLPLHGEIYAVNGDNIVAFNNIFVIIDVHMGVIYTCMGSMY